MIVPAPWDIVPGRGDNLLKPPSLLHANHNNIQWFRVHFINPAGKGL